MTFEFRIPILSEDSFFSNVKLAAISLAKLGGHYAAAPIHVSVNASVDDMGPVASANRWSTRYPVLWRPARASADHDDAAEVDRFAFSTRSDVIIFMDADACLLQPIDDLLSRLHDAEGPLVAGLAAHFPPFPDRTTAEAQWRNLLLAEGLHHERLDFTYSMLPAETGGRCPPYFNYGFVAFNAAGFEKISSVVNHYLERTLSRLEGTSEYFFSGQIALSLAIVATGVEAIALGPEYNCPNSDEMLGHGLKDSNDIKIMHYLRRELFDRHTFLLRRSEFDDFRSRTFHSPVLTRFQRHVLGLEDVFYNKRLIPLAPAAP